MYRSCLWCRCSSSSLRGGQVNTQPKNLGRNDDTMDSAGDITEGFGIPKVTYVNRELDAVGTYLRISTYGAPFASVPLARECEGVGARQEQRF